MKKLTICLCLFLALTACANKPIASPEEVNDYLDKLCYKEADYRR